MIAAVINRLRIVRRNHQRRVPLEAITRRLVVVLQRPDGLRLASAQIAPRKIAVLRFGVNNVRVAGIDAVVESVAALYRDPVLIADAELLHRRTGAAPGIIVLSAAADVVRLLKVVRDLIKLAQSDIVQVTPIAPAILGNPDASVVAR